MALIVVGVDGSEGGKRALHWALDEARLRGSKLRVVHAFQYPASSVAGADFWVGVDPEIFAGLDKLAEQRLAELVREVVGAEDDVEIEQKVVAGSSASVLVEEAADAELLVVGSRGLGGFKGLLLGSVSQQCAHHAPCPLAIIPSSHRSGDGP